MRDKLLRACHAISQSKGRNGKRVENCLFKYHDYGCDIAHNFIQCCDVAQILGCFFFFFLITLNSIEVSC